MIAAVTGEWTPLTSATEAAVKINALVAAYGTTAPFLRVYAGETATLAIMDGDAVLDGDSEEARLFLTMDPSVRRVRTDEINARRLAAMWQTDALCGDVMTPAATMTVDPAVEPLSPRDYWAVIQAVFGDALPAFDAWYTDVSHRWRHEQCRLVGIRESGQPVAVAMTTAEDPHRGVIGAVATLPTHRGRGYAGRIVTSLATTLEAAGKTVYLSPKNEYARALYERLGFIPCGRYGQVVR